MNAKEELHIWLAEERQRVARPLIDEIASLTKRIASRRARIATLPDHKEWLRAGNTAAEYYTLRQEAQNAKEDIDILIEILAEMHEAVTTVTADISVIEGRVDSSLAAIRRVKHGILALTADGRETTHHRAQIKAEALSLINTLDMVPQDITDAIIDIALADPDTRLRMKL